jgi:hypothetical protein
MFDYAKTWEGIGGQGHWPDADMIQAGKLSKRGPVGPERYSRFTEEELYTHISFWCLFRSPLMLGGNLPENRDIETKLFSNPEVIAVNQQGENPRQLYKKDGSMVWVSNVQNSSDIYVGLFNIADETHAVAIDFAQVGIKGKVQVRDLWKKADAGINKLQYKQNIAAHGAVLLRLQAIK